ncbi:MAG TPA: fibronectin type III domain-containing protein [Vicinamibacterales bacterium]|jgi:hypothetical protein
MFKTTRSYILLALLVLLAGRLEAGSVTISWDPNAEPDIAGYTVYWGTQSGVYTSSAAVGNVTSRTVSDLMAGQTYYFAVQATSIDGLSSPMSAEVAVTMPRLSPSGETESAWMARFGITNMAADDDGDGVTNQDEFTAGTDPTLPNTWFLAEGCTGFFKARIAIANPGIDTAEVTVKFLRQGAAPIIQKYSIPGLSRRTIRVNEIPGLENTSMSAEVTTQRGGVVVERTMTWGGAKQMNAGHTGKAVSRASTSWYFADGDAHGFDTYLLLANGNATDVNVEVLYYLASGKTLRDVYVVPANRRQTIYTNNVPGLGSQAFAMTVHASAPIVAERSMYFSTKSQWWKGGTDSTGVEAPSTQWFLAEGRADSVFTEYILLSNPNLSAAAVTIRYLRPVGDVITQVYQLAPESRTTIRVNDVPGLGNTDVSASIASTLPVVAERSMYWPGRQWHEGHNSAGVSELGTKWALAEGEDGGTYNTLSFIVMANPNSQGATVTITVVRDNQPPIVLQRTVAANSRVTVMSRELGLASGEMFGAMLESTNAVPIAVERSMYWDSPTVTWIGGTNESGIKLR